MGEDHYRTSLHSTDRDTARRPHVCGDREEHLETRGALERMEE